MNRKGFTLVELLATLVILGVVVGLTIVGVNNIFGNAKKKTEGVFVKTLTDALDIYLDSDAKNLSFNSNFTCKVDKSYRKDVEIYESNNNLTYADVIESKYSPLSITDLKNPANDKECLASTQVHIYRDQDYVYYYKVDKRNFNCFDDVSDSLYITNLPSNCY